MTSRNPDAEMHLMQRMWRELEKLPMPGRRRVLVYLFSRLDDLPAEGNGIDHGPQQLDIEDAIYIEKNVVQSLPTISTGSAARMTGRARN